MGTKTEKKDKIGILKFWAWQSRAISLGSMTIIYGYLMIYCTNTMGLNAGIVGTILLVSKVFDGVTDLFAGYLIDNTKTRFGKARPYEFAILGVWFFTWLLFTCPPTWSTTLKYIWVFVIYAFVNSILATLLNTNQTAYVVRAFPTMNQIVKVNSYGGIAVTLGCAVVSMLFPQLMGTMATSPAGWSKMIAIFAIPLALIGILRFVFVKETVQVEAESDGKLKVSEMIAVLKKNRYIWFSAALALLYNATLGMNATTYYFTYVVGDIGKYTMIAALSMPLLVSMFIFPALMKKIPISRIIMCGALLGVFGYGINFIAGGNIALLLLAGALYSLADLPIAYLSGMIILDCAEYNQLTGLHRAESTMSAFSCFGSKVGNGVGSALLGFVLGAGGFISTENANVVQPDSAIFTIKLLYSVIPALMFLIIAALMYFYKLDKVLPKLREEKQAQEATVEEAVM